MKKELNKLEKAIIEEIVKFNEKKIPNIKKHVCLLRVKSRIKTGIGIYVNFKYCYEVSKIDYIHSDIPLSSDKRLLIDGLKYEINYELNITNGKFDFLEIVTNGESWNGEYKSYSFVAP